MSNFGRVQVSDVLRETNQGINSLVKFDDL